MDMKPAMEAENGSHTLLTAKEAATISAKYLTDLLSLMARPTIEEIELADDRASWFITLGYISQELVPSYQFGNSKEFKTFVVDRTSGEVLSMKIRSIR